MIYLSILLLFLYYVYLKWKNVKDYWMEKGVPSTEFHPILGSLTFLLKRNPALWMRDLYNSTKSPYVGIWLFWRPALVINCPKLARQVLALDSDVFRNRLVSSGKNDPIGALNLFTVNDPLWTSVRRRLTPVFTSAKLKNLHHLYHEKSSNLVQRIKDDTEEGKRINLRELYADYATDVIGEASFGITCDATLVGHGALRNTTKEFSKFSVWRGVAWCSIFFFPELVDIFGFRFFPKKSIAYFKEVFNTIVKKRGGYEKKQIQQNDLVDALVKIKQEADNDDDTDFNEDVILAQAVIFLQGGFDTSSSSLSYITYELAFHPEYQDKVYNELVEAKQKLNGSEFDAKTLSELTFLNCVIKETLRKYPNLGWLDRVASSDYKIDDSLTIPAGTVIYVNGIGMQSDPNYFPEPEVFKPERFLPGNESKISPYTYIPFGEGPRHCIGKQFGLNTLRYALASLVLSYQFRPWKDSPQPNDCKIDKLGFFYNPGEILSVEFMPRN